MSTDTIIQYRMVLQPWSDFTTEEFRLCQRSVGKLNGFSQSKADSDDVEYQASTANGAPILVGIKSESIQIQTSRRKQVAKDDWVDFSGKAISAVTDALKWNASDFQVLAASFQYRLYARCNHYEPLRTFFLKDTSLQVLLEDTNAFDLEFMFKGKDPETNVRWICRLTSNQGEKDLRDEDYGGEDSRILFELHAVIFDSREKGSPLAELQKCEAMIENKLSSHSDKFADLQRAIQGSQGANEKA